MLVNVYSFPYPSIIWVVLLLGSSCSSMHPPSPLVDILDHVHVHTCCMSNSPTSIGPDMASPFSWNGCNVTVFRRLSFFLTGLRKRGTSLNFIIVLNISTFLVSCSSISWTCVLSSAISSSLELASVESDFCNHLIANQYQNLPQYFSLRISSTTFTFTSII